MKIITLVLRVWVLLLFINPLFAQKIELSRVEPAFWWVGMKNPELQLLVYGKDISYAKVSLNYPGVALKEVVSVENPNYLFVYLNILPTAQAGTFPIQFQWGKQSKIFNYELKKRAKSALDYAGFTNADAIYLITPDRFANGDPSNDQVAGMTDQTDRSQAYKRHGGDIKGMMNNLDYIADMGFTALWVNPLLENNQPQASYHGYAITDFYKIDARFGTNEDYRKLTEMCHQRGLKMIQDMVFNHSGLEHWFVKDLPMKDWIHQFPTFTRSNYRLSTSFDPYVSDFDRDKMAMGWFDTSMPDLNQRNRFLGTYLTQNSIWWIEYVGLDGIRMDTHPYPYKDFMAQWCKAVLTEYPNFNIVGEVWEENSVPAEAYWQMHAPNKDGYQSYLPSVTDFPLCLAYNKAFNEQEEWNTGLLRIYYTLTQDVLYPNPNDNVIFLDNHDLTRFATSVNKDLNKMKMGLASLLTMRGVPQIYYGTEIMMEGPGNDHGKLRGDFPGGWEGDSKNAFTKQGLTSEEADLQAFTRKLLQWRKTKKVIQYGKLMHFIPEDNLYVYFRYDDQETVMVVLNNHQSAKTLDMQRFKERLRGFSSAYNVITGENISALQTLNLPPKSATVLELK
ncbi:MAG: glycoside hydrolase family 13 protein [Microscillaceae bacterium]|jgi:glycosidase|nr:glycoside hydrolase family 13 protein [Microscillaceae bacterium]